jgi:hypothetical protein
MGRVAIVLVFGGVTFGLGYLLARPSTNEASAPPEVPVRMQLDASVDLLPDAALHLTPIEPPHPTRP